MDRILKQIAHKAAAAFLVIGVVYPSSASLAYPSKNVSLVVPVQAGSQTDVLARIIAEPLHAKLKVPFIVENRGGGGGTIASTAVARSAADGHTLLYGSMSSIILAPQLRNPKPYDPTKDFIPIAITAVGPTVLVVRESSEIKTIDDLVAFGRANPGKLNLGSHGVGAFSHIAMELFMELTGTKFQHIPYAGGGPLLLGFLAGDVDVVLFDSVTILPQVKAGKARPLALISAKRSPVYPGVPTVAETVAPSLKHDFWLGIFAPANTPASVVDILNTEINSIMSAPAARAVVESASMTSPNQTSEEFAQRVAAEWTLWGDVIRKRGIAPR